MKRTRSVTIREVARAAGVSVQTVSRVLNNQPDVAAETRARIQEIITRLGYAPNTLARALIKGRSHTLGVVAYGLGYYGPSRTLTGIERQANELGYSLLLCLLREPENSPGADLLAGLLARQVDGVIWAVPEVGGSRETLLAAAASAPVPIVYINASPRAGQASVAIDNALGGRLAAECLLQQGCRKVGMITGPRIWWEGEQRAAGFRAGLLESGLFSASDLDRRTVEGDWYPSSGAAGMQRLLDACPDLDAVFACNDQMAIGAMQTARRLGRRVPEDLAVVGFDDIPEAAYLSPPLSTVRQPITELGAKSVLLLHELLSAPPGSAPQPPVWLAPELIVRESSRRNHP